MPDEGQRTPRRAFLSPLGLPLVLAGLTLLAQITYPLLDGRALVVSTVVTVLLFCATSLSHAALSLGARAAVLLLLVAGGIGLVAEAVGTATGFPFGPYEYTGTLGPEVLDVPVVIPLAWTMMAWPTLLLGRRLAAAVLGRVDNRLGRRTAAFLRAVVTAAVGGFALASWDLYLDPQMTDAGHWVFSSPEPGLPGVPGIPLTNYAGWLLVAVLMISVLDAVIPNREVEESVPALMLAWTWLGSGLANVAFFGRPEVAAYGFVGMGLVVAPYLWLFSRHHRRTAATGSTGPPGTNGPNGPRHPLPRPTRA
ncbi:carotenoid biosynthesis protein [Aquipuribacter sp. MA13-6]|uniref:carotenoid biosynthesis protein n=1 Tax=unclassified Aquipuribacter TaxID=2635084 RepID=UPI003EF004A1